MSSEIVSINENYTEKAVAVFGNTKPYLEELKNIGGKYNQYLKQNGSTSPGWIFPKTKLSVLKALVDKINNGSIKPAAVVEKKDTNSTSVSRTPEVKVEQKSSTENTVVLSKDEFKYIMNTLQKLEQEVNALKKQLNPTVAVVKKPIVKKQETPPSSESEEDYDEEEQDDEEEEEEVKKPVKKGPSLLGRK
jgi:peptidoglycan hydrolase-like amidase